MKNPPPDPHGLRGAFHLARGNVARMERPAQGHDGRKGARRRFGADRNVTQVVQAARTITIRECVIRLSASIRDWFSRRNTRPPSWLSHRNTRATVNDVSVGVQRYSSRAAFRRELHGATGQSSTFRRADQAPPGSTSLILVVLQYSGSGIIKTVITLPTGNASVQAIAYHAIAPHVVLDTPLIAKVSGVR